MRPFRLQPLLKERPWGVRSLAPWLADVVGAAPIGEAWFTSNESQLAGGPTLGEAIAADPASVLGREARDLACPLLLKFLFTSERLSVQVHPDDEYARVHHGSLGKTEAWHVLDARPGATLGLGFTRRLARDEAVQAATTGAIEQLLDWRPAATGTTWLVPARTVHAIGAGFTILEIQENSDLTYRLYDYGRPRELHLEHGFEVADLGPYEVANRPAPIAPGRDRLTSCPYFMLERWDVHGALTCTPSEPFYHLLVVTAGGGSIADQETRRGDVWLIPARVDPCSIQLTHGEMLVAHPGAEPTAAFSRE